MFELFTLCSKSTLSIESLSKTLNMFFCSNTWMCSNTQNTLELLGCWVWGGNSLYIYRSFLCILYIIIISYYIKFYYHLLFMLRSSHLFWEFVHSTFNDPRFGTQQRAGTCSNRSPYVQRARCRLSLSRRLWTCSFVRTLECVRTPRIPWNS